MFFRWRDNDEYGKSHRRIDRIERKSMPHWPTALNGSVSGVSSRRTVNSCHSCVSSKKDSAKKIASTFWLIPEGFFRHWQTLVGFLMFFLTKGWLWGWLLNDLERGICFGKFLLRLRVLEVQRFGSMTVYFQLETAFIAERISSFFSGGKDVGRFESLLQADEADHSPVPSQVRNCSFFSCVWSPIRSLTDFVFQVALFRETVLAGFIGTDEKKLYSWEIYGYLCSEIFIWNRSVVQVRSTDWLIDWPVDRVGNRSIDRLIDWFPDIFDLVFRSIHTTRRLFDLEQKSKVELAVEALKEDKASSSKAAAGVAAGKDASAVPAVPGQPEQLPVVVPKKTLWQKVVAECKHYYHGFRLLGTEIAISWGLLMKIIRGDSLSRREHKQVRRLLHDPLIAWFVGRFLDWLIDGFADW